MITKKWGVIPREFCVSFCFLCVWWLLLLTFCGCGYFLINSVGAASPVMKESIRAITSALANNNNNNMIDPQDIYKSVLSKSFVISCDQAHAIHPNYAGKHEKQHAPKLNHRMVIKRNANQRYASTPVTSTQLRQAVFAANANANAPSPPYLQEFIVRQDCGCGSTIGPIISTNTGLRTIDVGMPSLSMHSIRECMGVYDGKFPPRKKKSRLGHLWLCFCPHTPYVCVCVCVCVCVIWFVIQNHFFYFGTLLRVWLFVCRIFFSLWFSLFCWRGIPVLEIFCCWKRNGFQLFCCYVFFFIPNLEKRN